MAPRPRSVTASSWRCSRTPRTRPATPSASRARRRPRSCTTPSGCCTRSRAPTPRGPRIRAGGASPGTRRSTRSRRGSWRLPGDHGAESVVFSSASPSTSAMSDSVDWLMRLRRAFGSPNQCIYMELCGWGRYLAPLYTFGAPVPGTYLPDLDQAGCILYWGYNPSVSRLSHATSTVAALARGARLVVVDPRRAGLATKADHWLRVRPGTDAALALSLTNVMIENGWFDEEFVRRWTNAPLLVRADTGRLLRADALSPAGDPSHYVAWDEVAARSGRVRSRRAAGTRSPRNVSPSFGVHQVTTSTGDRDVPHRRSTSSPRPCRRMRPPVAETITGVPADDIERDGPHAVGVATARVLRVERARAAEQRHPDRASGSPAVRPDRRLRRPGRQRPVPQRAHATRSTAWTSSAPTSGARLSASPQRPLGPARFEFVTGEDVYTAALEGRPYRVRGMVNLGANLVMAHGDSARGRDALAALDFFVHADLFMNPTAEHADIVLPVTSAFEAEGLRVGFEISAGGPVTGAAAPTARAAAGRGPVGSPDHLRARGPPRTRRALLGRGPGRRLPPPARPQRRHPRTAPR